MNYIIIAIFILGLMLWGVVSVFEWVSKVVKRLKPNLQSESGKDIIERNQDIIETALEKMRGDDSWPHYVENKVRDCIGDIAKLEGNPHFAPKYREWLSAWERRSDIPAEYQKLKTHLEEKFKARFDVLKKDRKRLESEREQLRKENIEKGGEQILRRNKDLVDKFLEITERKVSVIDDYGDENFEILPDEILACLKKISQRENARIDWQRYSKPRSYYSLPDEYEWLKAQLDKSFKEYHNSQKTKPTRAENLEKLTGVEFENWIVKLLKENDFSDVQGTPATGDQGADLIAKKNGRTIIIQAKRYQGSVSNKAVQEVISAVGFYNGDEGWVMTNSSFTTSAKALAHKMNIRLIDGHDLKRFHG